MCLGIPGQIVEFSDEHPDLAVVDVVGVKRRINVGLVHEDGVKVGDWVLIHVGFAMSIIDEHEASTALEGLKMMGREYDDELQALTESKI